MDKIIPYGCQNITDEDIESVCDVLRSDYLTQGPFILEFEKKFAEYIGVDYAVAVSNGTAALHLSILALDIKKGDKVITTPITFAASANCVKYCGGEIVFSDIDPDTYLLDLNKLEELLANNIPGTFKGVIAVDFAGRAIDLEKLKIITEKYGLWILEDACHSPGGFFVDSKGVQQNCGNGKFAELSIFSFHPVKHIATGEGGMITTNSYELYQKLLILRTHGITRDPNLFKNSITEALGNLDTNLNISNYPNWYMEMQTLGYNYRLTDIQAALGLSQLKRAEEGIQKRRLIAKKYVKAFEGAKFIKGHSGDIQGHAYHLFVIEVKDKRLELYNFLKNRSIITQVHYFPCHLMPYYKKENQGERICLPFSESYYSCCLSLPMFPTLKEEEQEYVINSIEKFYA